MRIHLDKLEWCHIVVLAKKVTLCAWEEKKCHSILAGTNQWNEAADENWLQIEESVMPVFALLLITLILQIWKKSVYWMISCGSHIGPPKHFTCSPLKGGG